MLTLQNARIVDGTGLRHEAADLSIEDGRIASVSPGTGRRAPDTGAERATLDLAGLTLVPGLMNAHTHICLDGGADPAGTLMGENTVETAVRSAHRLVEIVRAGVTTLRDVGGPNHIDIALKRMVERGENVGPRLLVSGKVITMTGGHGHWMGREADGPDEARRAAREQIKAGADVIKLMATGGMMTAGQEAGAPQLTVEEMAAAIEEAHKAGCITAAHVESAQGGKNALRAGIDSIEHGHGIDAEAVEMMLARGVPMVPTISSDVAILEHGKEAGIPDFVVEKCARLYERLVESLGLAIRSGVEIVAGNDGGAPFVFIGDIVTELELYVKHGLTPLQALRSATLSAARLFRLAEAVDGRPPVGKIELGYAADLVAVAGDPLADISALRQVRLVIRDGAVLRNDGLASRA